MAFKTMQQLITDVEKAIYQSAGPQVQLYSQDIIMQYIQDAFTHLFDLHFWPRFNARELANLDGVSGQTVSTLATINDYKDIRYIFPGTYERPLAHMPQGYNTSAMTGTMPRFIEGTADTRLFRVWPLTAVGSILVVGRNRPAPFILTDPVPFDDLLIRHFAAWSYFTDDDSNPASAARHQGLFENRLKAIETSEFNHPIQLDTNSNYIPDRWSEARW